MKKILIPIAALFIIYLISAISFLNEDVDYYGVVSEDNETIKTMINPIDDRTMENYKVDAQSTIQHGDIVKVSTTDNKGVILKEEKIKKEDLPKALIHSQHFN